MLRDMSDARHIQVLSIHVANKIAAGEVVDRPASVVKELMENALDAGGTQIDLEVVAGGRKLVAVSDSGRGMNRDDALLSIERQATSKIRDVDDIEHIATLGFRGEALAAIASVSRFRLVTCQQGDVTGTELVITGGRIQEVNDIGAPGGTRIEVRDLFFNVPARRKFLRAYQTELSHIRNCFITQALAHPEVGMSLKVDGRMTYQLSAGDALANRVRELFGTEYLTQMREVSAECGDIGVAGFVSGPGFHRADRAEQYLFVNSRSTSAPVLNYAIREAFRTLIPDNRHPCVFLFLTMPTDLVDVNVHPTKREVRFRKPSDVRDAVIHAVRKSLPEDASRDSDKAQEESVTPAEKPTAEVQLSITDLDPGHTFHYPRMSGPEAQPAVAATRPFSGRVGDSGEQGDAVASANTVEAKEEGPDLSSAPWSWCRVLGQVAGQYVVLETEDGMVLMDPRAAHERVIFETLMKQAEQGDVAVQQLLMPENVELPPRDVALLRKHLDVVRSLGFGISEFGGNSLLVDALPQCLGTVSAREVLAEMPHVLEQAGVRRGQGRWREESVAQAASRAAVTGRRKFTLQEIEKLVIDLAGCEMPYTNPRGRPTLIFTSVQELNKKFGRV